LATLAGGIPDRVPLKMCELAAFLLATTEDSVLGIIMDCGCKHLGLSYSLFKAHFHFTESRTPDIGNSRFLSHEPSTAKDIARDTGSRADPR
jgi:hypothetical protein